METSNNPTGAGNGARGVRSAALNVVWSMRSVVGTAMRSFTSRPQATAKAPGTGQQLDSTARNESAGSTKATAPHDAALMPAAPGGGNGGGGGGKLVVQVDITAPSNGATVTWPGPIIVSGTASWQLGADGQPSGNGITIGIHFAGRFITNTSTDADGNWTYSGVVPNKGGPMEIEVKASTGDSSLSATVWATPITVTIPNIAPDLTIDTIDPQPTNGKILGTASGVDVTFKGTASDPQAGVSVVEVSLDNQTFQPATTSDGWAHWSTTVHISAMGPHTIIIRATDTVGLQSEQQTAVEVVASYPLQDPTLRAYLKDLLDFASYNVTLGSGAPLDRATLASQFLQPFQAYEAADAVTSTAPIHQVRIAIEVLRAYLKTLQVPPSVQGALASAENDYRLQAYKALLINIGTSYDEVRLAHSADDKTRHALADRLGIDLESLRPDKLDQLLLMQPTAIAESDLERLFGLRDTTRDPLTDTPRDPLTDTPACDLSTWQQDHLRTLWSQQDHPATSDLTMVSPLIDPDLLGPNDLVVPPTGKSNPANVPLQERQKWVNDQLLALAGNVQTGETDAARLDRLIDSALGTGTVAALVALDAQRASGTDITSTLPPGLAFDAFSYLMRMRNLAASTAPVTLLGEEWDDIYSILVQVQKVRSFAAWRTAEAAVTLSPDYFVVAAAPPLPRWRATSAARSAWEDTLNARINQRQTVAQALQAAVDAVEAIVLPVLRDALIAAVQASIGAAAPDLDVANVLTEVLLIDMQMGGRLATTRLAQAIDTVQGVIAAVRLGRFQELVSQLGGTLAAQLGATPLAAWSLTQAEQPNTTVTVFDQEWDWMSTYTMWRSAMLVFLYPENLLLPNLRKSNTPAFASLLDEVRGAAQVTPATVLTAAHDYLTVLPSNIQNALTAASLTLTAPRDATDLKAFRDTIKAQYPTTGSPPPSYLAEVFWDVPMYLAMQLQQAGQYEAALDWFRTVYAYDLSGDDRKIYYGFVLEHGITTLYVRNPQQWLSELDPHDIAAQWRADAYTGFTLISIVRCVLDYADAEFASATAESVSLARDLYLMALNLLQTPELQPLPAAQQAGIAPNSVLQALQQHAQNNLSKLRDGRNIAGLEGGPVAADTATASLSQPTPYRYATLVDRAKQLVTIAQQIEASYLGSMEKADAEAYNALKARQDLGLAQANVQVQDLRVSEATDGVALASLQQQRAQVQQDTYQQWLNAGLNQWESGMIQSYTVARDARDMVAGLDAGITVAQAAATASSGGLFGAGLSGAWAAVGTLAVLSYVRANAQAAANNAETAAQVDSANASFERRTQEWQLQESLAQKDVAIGAQQVVIAQAHVAVAQGERRVAQMQADHAQATVDFLANKFTNADLYEWMSGVLGRVYGYFLQQATAIARLAQSQLAFERQEKPLAFIQGNYWQAPSTGTTGNSGTANGGASGTAPDRRGLTGSARLLEDIYQLDQYAFDTDKRKLQLTKTISLAQVAPLEFQNFRETGMLRFATPMDLFDRDFPGHYLRLIKQVRTSMIALIPPTQGIRATLASTGVSRVTVMDDTGVQTVVVRHNPELVALTSPMNATGLFALDTQPGMLLPFEDMGVDTTWELQLPRAANPFDYTTIGDVLISIDYTALYSLDYQQQVIKRLDRSFKADRAYSLRQDFPDQWYDLHNPDQSDQSRTPMSVSLGTVRTDFPPNLEDVRIVQVVLAYAVADTSAVSLVATNLTFTADGGGGAPGGIATPIDGVISTRRGNGNKWLAMIGQQPVGTWQLALPNDTATRALFGIGSSDPNGAIDDILLIITYSGVTPAWPA